MKRENILNYNRYVRKFLEEYQAHLERFCEKYPKISKPNAFIRVMDRALYFGYGLIEATILKLANKCDEQAKKAELIENLSLALSFFKKKYNELYRECEKDNSQEHYEIALKFDAYFSVFFAKCEELLDIKFIVPTLGDKFEKSNMTAIKTYMLTKEQRMKISRRKDGVIACGKVGIQDNSGQILKKAEVATYEQEQNK